MSLDNREFSGGHAVDSVRLAIIKNSVGSIHGQPVIRLYLRHRISRRSGTSAKESMMWSGAVSPRVVHSVVLVRNTMGTSASRNRRNAAVAPGTGLCHSRYKRFGDDTMDETFFPITWRHEAIGRRSSSPSATVGSDGPAQIRSLEWVRNRISVAYPVPR
jgi:hypothetical protein